MRFEAFSSTAHRYARLEWSDEKNESVYGDSFSREGLGHNFRLVLTTAENATFSTENPAAVLIRKIDHKFLDENEAYFAKRVSSLENITEFLFAESLKLWPELIVSLEVYEGESLSALRTPSGLFLRKNYRTRSSQAVYDVEISFSGPIHSESGLLVERPKLKSIEQKHLSQITEAALAEQTNTIAALHLSISSVNVRNALDGKTLKNVTI